MQIETTHHIDCSEKSADGFYEYYYEYDLFRFSEGGFALVARGYTDSPSEAHFLRIERDGVIVGISEADLRTPLALAATDHLRSLGRRKIDWLGPVGYAPLPLNENAEPDASTNGGPAVRGGTSLTLGKSMANDPLEEDPSPRKPRWSVIPAVALAVVGMAPSGLSAPWGGVIAIHDLSGIGSLFVAFWLVLLPTAIFAAKTKSEEHASTAIFLLWAIALLNLGGCVFQWTALDRILGLIA